MVITEKVPSAKCSMVLLVGKFQCMIKVAFLSLRAKDWLNNFHLRRDHWLLAEWIKCALRGSVRIALGGREVSLCAIETSELLSLGYF